MRCRLHTGVCGAALPCNALCAACGLCRVFGLHQPDGHTEVVWQGEGAVAPQSEDAEQAQGQGGCVLVARALLFCRLQPFQEMCMAAIIGDCEL